MTTEANSPTPSSSSPSVSPITVGVLALQGSFREHSTALRRLPGVTALEVRTADELRRCDGLVIPGGESTTMALVAERWGLVGPLKEYAGSGKPLWGTCAGLIFLANRAVGEFGSGGERDEERKCDEPLKFYYCVHAFLVFQTSHTSTSTSLSFPFPSPFSTTQA